MSGMDGENGKRRGHLLLAYIVVAIVRWDVLLVHIAIMCHRVPGPGRVSSDSTYMIPVISRTCIVYHVVWAGSENVNGVTVMPWRIAY